MTLRPLVLASVVALAAGCDHQLPSTAAPQNVPLAPGGASGDCDCTNVVLPLGCVGCPDGITVLCPHYVCDAGVCEAARVTCPAL